MFAIAARQALPLAAQAEHHGAVDLDLGRAARRRPASSAIVVPSRSANAARAGGRANTDPIDARTALGDHGSAQSGPRITGPSASACAERMIVPTLPGSWTPCRYTHSSPLGSDQRCGKTPTTRAPEPSVLTRGEQVGLDVLAGRQQQLGLEARGGGGVDQVLALGHGQPQLVAVLALLELAECLELGVVLAGDHWVSVEIGFRNEKGRLAGRPG